MRYDKSTELYKRALLRLVGGVNSPVRAFHAVGGTPIFISSAHGAYIYDEDGDEYIDCVCSWGPLILGHAHPLVVEAVKKAAESGTSFGASTSLEVQFADLICKAFPSIQKIRLVNSGTEATMSAIRLARAYTKRNVIVKFDGCYHGHADPFLVKAGSGLSTLGIPASPGVPSSVVADVISLPYNHVEPVRQAFASRGKEIAAVIIEPFAGNMGLVTPADDFLPSLRAITNEFESLLIFDEVISGFRFMFGGAQHIAGVEPDLTTLGKIIGGGLPIGAYGGRHDIMDLLAPLGSVYQAGTLSGNPVAVSAGLATLKVLKETQPYEELDKTTRHLADEIRSSAARFHIPLHINNYGSLLTLFFTREPVIDFNSALKADTKIYAKFFHSLLHQGIYIPPSAFECWFLSSAHNQGVIEKILESITNSMRRMNS